MISCGQKYQLFLVLVPSPLRLFHRQRISLVSSDFSSLPIRTLHISLFTVLALQVDTSEAPVVSSSNGHVTDGDSVTGSSASTGLYLEIPSAPQNTPIAPTADPHPDPNRSSPFSAAGSTDRQDSILSPLSESSTPAVHRSAPIAVVTGASKGSEGDDTSVRFVSESDSSDVPVTAQPGGSVTPDSQESSGVERGGPYQSSGPRAHDSGLVAPQPRQGFAAGGGLAPGGGGGHQSLRPGGAGLRPMTASPAVTEERGGGAGAWRRSGAMTPDIPPGRANGGGMGGGRGDAGGHTGTGPDRSVGAPVGSPQARPNLRRG